VNLKAVLSFFDENKNGLLIKNVNLNLHNFSDGNIFNITLTHTWPFVYFFLIFGVISADNFARKGRNEHKHQLSVVAGYKD